MHWHSRILSRTAGHIISPLPVFFKGRVEGEDFLPPAVTIVAPVHVLLLVEAVGAVDNGRGAVSGSGSASMEIDPAEDEMKFSSLFGTPGRISAYRN